MAETEFTIVRTGGDKEASDKLYAGMNPMTAGRPRRPLLVAREPAAASQHQRDRADAGQPELRRLRRQPRGLIPAPARCLGRAMSIDQRLAELGITLPQAAAPVASYVPAVEAGGLLHISGQISFAEDGSLIKGRLGEDMELEAGSRPRGAAASCCSRKSRPRSARSTGSSGS